MGGIRDDFYRSIRTDYRLFESDSVIFRFFREEQERLYRQFLEKKKNGTADAQGSYLFRLQEHMELLREGKEAPEAFVRQLFLILNGRRALYQDSLGTENDPGDFLRPLLAVCLGTEEKELQGRMQRYIRELAESWEKESEAIGERLRESPFAEPPWELLSELGETVLERAAHMEIRAFFYDAGYPLTEERKKNRARRMDKTLCLLEAYCGEKGYALFDDRKRFSDGECEAFFRGLNREDGRRDMFFPLKVDSRTGCALYIIGRSLYQGNHPGYPEKKEILRKEERKPGRGMRAGKGKRPERVCCYGVLRASTDVQAGTVGYVLDDGDAFGSLEVACNAYQEACDEAWEEICENFRRSMPPDCPQVFRDYFRSGYGADPEEIAAARQETEREFRRKTAEDQRQQPDPKKKLLHSLIGRR